MLPGSIAGVLFGTLGAQGGCPIRGRLSDKQPRTKSLRRGRAEALLRGSRKVRGPLLGGQVAADGPAEAGGGRGGVGAPVHDAAVVAARQQGAVGEEGQG